MFSSVLLFEIFDWVVLFGLIGGLLFVTIMRQKTIYNLQQDWINSKQAIQQLGLYVAMEHLLIPLHVVFLAWLEETFLCMLHVPWALSKFGIHIVGGNNLDSKEMHKKGYLGRYKNIADIGFFLYFLCFFMYFIRLWKEIIDEVIHKPSARHPL